MKKKLLYISLISSLIIPSTFAFESSETNACIENIDEHLISGWGLNLSKCNIKDKDIAIINAFIEKHELIGLILDGNQITELGATELAKNKTVGFLRISSNTINDKGAIELAKNKVLRSLEVESNGIGDAGVIALVQNKNLSYLRIGPTTLSFGMDKFSLKAASAIANNTTLEYLDIFGNAFDYSGIAELAKNTTLTGLYLHKVELDTNSLQALTKMTGWLAISYSNIGDDGARTLATDSNLTGLDFGDANISDEGLMALAKMPKLTSFGLFNGDSVDYPQNHITANGIEALIKSTSLEWLALSNLKIDDESAAIIAGSPTLRFLYLADNNIGNVGAIALSKSTSLRYLNLIHNHIGQLGRDALAGNSYIEDLYLDENNGEFKAQLIGTHCKYFPRIFPMDSGFCNPSVMFSSQVVSK
jgi:hypothetical protein